MWFVETSAFPFLLYCVSVFDFTAFTVPSEPRELQGQILEGGIFITWKPPAEPNGNITTYLVMYQILTSTQNLNHWEIKSVNGTRLPILIIMNMYCEQ